jgi:CRISPR-associated protein Cas2
MMEELSCYLFYDIEDDRVRNKVSEACKDFGLERIQYSGFFGYLNRNRREELFLMLKVIMNGNSGRILLQPVCEKDLKNRKEIVALKEDTFA